MPPSTGSVTAITINWCFPTAEGWHRQVNTQSTGQSARRDFRFPTLLYSPKSLTDYTAFVLEITMPKINLSRMTVEGLMDLRERVEETLHKRRAELHQQLAALGVTRVVRGGGSTLKGRKVPPKYRSPSGETWAGRGAKPRWLVAAIKGGKKLDDFLIDKSARKGRKKRRSKR